MSTRTNRREKHEKHCPCRRCTRSRLAEYEARVQMMSVPRAPTSPDQLVPVRAHFRRQPNYLNKDEALHKLVSAFVRGLIGESR